MRSKDRVKSLGVAILLTFAFSLSAAFGQSPEKMSYQAVIRDSDDNLITDTQVGMQISILQGSASGKEVYEETQEPTTNTSGLVSLEIGTGTTSDDFSAIDWSDGPYFLQTEIDISGGTNYTITATNQLLSVPYALHAESAKETDPVFIVSTAAGIETEDINNWDEAYSWGDHSNESYATEPYANDLINEIYEILETEGYVIKDIDGNFYPIVTIGSQVWMTKNLRTTKFNDGTPIPKVEDDSEWSSISTPAYSWYDNDSVQYNKPYGALYNWYAASAGNLCPTGWHVPTEAEMETLITFLGGQLVAGGKLKKTGTEYWNSPNEGATNESGFTAIAMGSRSYNGSFLNYENFKNNARYMSATEGASTPPPGSGVYMILYHNSTNAYISSLNKRAGMSIRCIKD